MQVNFESRDPDGARLRNIALARLRAVTKRFSAVVPRATVQLSDINGPRGGVDKRCQVALTTQAGANLIVVSQATSWRGALDNALARASRVLARTWRRSRNTEHALEHRLKREFGKTAHSGAYSAEHPAAYSPMHSTAQAAQSSRAGEHTTLRNNN
jgi:hypothetical protein